MSGVKNSKVVKSKDVVRRKGLWTSDQLKKAIDLIENENHAIRAAGKKYGIPESTLRRRMSSSTPRVNRSSSPSFGRLPVFNKEQELMITKKILESSNIYHGLTPRQCQSVAFNLAEKCNIKNNFNSKTRLAGTKWLRNYMGRSGDISIRKPEATSINRIQGFTKEEISIFFNNLKSVTSIHKIAPSRIFNLDETGITTVHRPPNILAKKGQKQVGKATSGERGRTTTVLCCVSATGVFHPPMFIFARQRSSPLLKKGAPEGSMVEISKNGWINEVLFFKYIKTLVASLHPQLQGKIPTASDKLEPALIVMDNHESHRSLEVIDYCKLHNVSVVTLPPHTSHRTQPLDITFFGPLKSKFNQVCDEFVLSGSNGLNAITPFHLCELFAKAYNSVASPDKGINGFKCTGIHPLNEHIFQKNFGFQAEDSTTQQSAAEERVDEDHVLEKNADYEHALEESTGGEHAPKESAVVVDDCAIKISDTIPVQIECSLNADENNMVICDSEGVPISKVIYVVDNSCDMVNHNTDVILDLSNNFNSTATMCSSLTESDKTSVTDETLNCTATKTSENFDFVSALTEQFKFSSQQESQVNKPKKSNSSEVLTSSPIRKQIADKKIKKIEEEKLKKIKKEKQEIMKKNKIKLKEQEKADKEAKLLERKKAKERKLEEMRLKKEERQRKMAEKKLQEELKNQEKENKKQNAAPKFVHPVEIDYQRNIFNQIQL